jgi:hypothetical protein
VGSVTVGDLGRLRREFDRLIEDDLGEVAKQVVGPHLQEVVLDVCKGIAWKYPPSRYTGRPGADRWDRGDDEASGDFHDLASEVVLKLWEEEQVEWILEQAETISDARGLIGFHVQRTLSKRLETTAMDNLRRRAKVLLAEDPFIPTTPPEHLGDETRYIVGGAPSTEPWRAEERFAEAVRRVALIRPLKSHAAQERNPRVYNDRGPRSLEACLRAMASVYTEGFDITEFEDVLEVVLADYFASHLVLDEVSDEGGQEDPVGDQVMLDELAKEAVAGLNEEGRLIARCKLIGMSDAKVANLRGYSRATAREKWQGVKEYLAGALDGLEEPQVLYVGDRINRLLADGGDNEDG